MAIEDKIREDKDKSFHGDKQGNNNPIVNLQLSDKLKQKGVVQNISVDRRASTIEVILNHGSKKTIVSTIYPNWDKTQRNFEKQANRKNLSKGDIVDIQDVLDDNHATILQGILFDDVNESPYTSNSQIINREKQEIINDIKKLRLDHSNITPEAWQSELEKKHQHLQNVIEKNFPSLRPALEFELSVQKILNIKGCTLPFAGIILGPPSSLKTQVIELLRRWPHTFYTDNFSAKSFVSHTTAVSREQLEQIDLLPKIKNKCFLTPELAPTFAAKDDDLVQILGIMTRILDGNGYESDSGAQGHRGYNGKTMFVMVGAAVDIAYKVHKILGNLGAKLYFFRPPKVQKTENDYLIQIKNDDFGIKISEIGEALVEYLKWFEIGPDMEVDKESGLVKMPWNHAKNDDTAQRYIIRLASL